MRRPRGQPLAQPDPGQRLGGSFPSLLHCNARIQQPVGDVLERGRVLGEEELLEHEADPGRPHSRQLPIGQLLDVETGD